MVRWFGSKKVSIFTGLKMCLIDGKMLPLERLKGYLQLLGLIGRQE